MSRRPDYRLCGLDPSTGKKNNGLGAAWTNADGSISLVLNPFVTLTGQGDPVLRLFPTDRPPFSQERAAPQANTAPGAVSAECPVCGAAAAPSQEWCPQCGYGKC